MVRDVAKWDYLVSPSPTCSEIFRSAFGFEGEIWETGYPRNDVLRSPGAGPGVATYDDSWASSRARSPYSMHPRGATTTSPRAGRFQQSVLLDPEV